MPDASCVGTRVSDRASTTRMCQICEPIFYNSLSVRWDANRPHHLWLTLILPSVNEGTYFSKKYIHTSGVTSWEDLSFTKQCGQNSLSYWCLLRCMQRKYWIVFLALSPSKYLGNYLVTAAATLGLSLLKCFRPALNILSQRRTLLSPFAVGAIELIKLSIKSD